MKNIFRSFLSLFFPDLCIVCHNRLNDAEKHICITCLTQLPKTNYHDQPDNRLEEYLAGRFPFQRIAAFAYFVKGGSMQSIIHELKYKNNPDIGYTMGLLYGSDIAISSFCSNIDYIIPVPLHPKRMKQRGYNQSEEIAKGISSETGIAIDTTTLIRSKNNPSQTKNNRIERWKNVEEIFELTNKEIFRDKHILLIDDVITTGSTIEACAKEILKCKDVKISIAALAVAT